MEFIDILVRELPKRGGWPEGAVECVRFVDEATIDFYDENGNWPDDCSLTYGPIAKAICITPTEPCQRETVKFSEYEAALAASKPEWDGEGLPPVGCRIEYTCKQPDAGHPAIEAGKWYGGTIIAYYGEGVWTSDNGIRHLSNTIFRPLRSEEYNKRYEAIEALFEIIDAGVSTSQDSIYIYDAIAAGKIPHIRID